MNTSHLLRPLALALGLAITLVLTACQAQPVPSRNLEAFEAEQSMAPPIQQAPTVPRQHGYWGGGYRSYGY